MPRPVGAGALGREAQLGAGGAPGVGAVGRVVVAQYARSVVIPRAADQATARRSTPMVVAAVSSLPQRMRQNHVRGLLVRVRSGEHEMRGRDLFQVPPPAARPSLRATAPPGC